MICHYHTSHRYSAPILSVCRICSQTVKHTFLFHTTTHTHGRVCDVEARVTLLRMRITGPIMTNRTNCALVAGWRATRLDSTGMFRFLSNRERESNKSFEMMHTHSLTSLPGGQCVVHTPHTSRMRTTFTQHDSQYNPVRVSNARRATVGTQHTMAPT